MSKKVKGIKKFVQDFKAFISRGNVLDMAVGIIIGGAFTAIVTAMTNGILQPIINKILSVFMGDKGLESAVWILSPAYDLVDGVKTLNLANSIYIDWGSLITAIINFMLVAFVLFMIVRTVAKVNEAQEKLKEGLEIDEKKEIVKICHEERVGRKKARQIYETRLEEAKLKKAEEEKAAQEKAAEDARLAEEKAMANTKLLEEIRDLLKNK